MLYESIDSIANAKNVEDKYQILLASKEKSISKLLKEKD